MARTVGTPADHRVIGANIDTRSTYWCDSLYWRSWPTCAEMATIGVLLVVASATPSCMLIAPGPSVAETTAARPVTRPYISAMNDAGCACRVSTYRMLDEASACTKRMFSSPGSPKTTSTPSFSRHLTISSAALLIGTSCSLDRVNLARRSADSSSGCTEWLGRYSGPISGPEPCPAAAIDAQ